MKKKPLHFDTYFKISSINNVRVIQWLVAYKLICDQNSFYMMQSPPNITDDDFSVLYFCVRLFPAVINFQQYGHLGIR